MKDSLLLLPEGWFWSDSEKAAELLAEYRRELPPIHPLAGIAVEIIAHREATDDILVRHVQEPNQVSVIHLTWTGREELPDHPTVDLTGSFEQFVDREITLYGIPTHYVTRPTNHE